MKIFFACLVALAVVFGGSYVLLTRGDQTWRQKLIVTVSTPNGDVSGEAVTEVSMHINRVFRDGGRFQYKLKGEATFVDLGNGRYLIAPLSSQKKPEAVVGLVPQIVARSIIDQGRNWENVFLRKIHDFKGPILIPENLHPGFVTFTDLSDPRSVVEILPGSELQLLGSGYYLKSVSIEITDEPTTHDKAEKILPWLHDIWPNMLDGQRYWNAKSPIRTANELGANSFSTEIEK